MSVHVVNPFITTICHEKGTKYGEIYIFLIVINLTFLGYIIIYYSFTTRHFEWMHDDFVS